MLVLFILFTCYRSISNLGGCCGGESPFDSGELENVFSDDGCSCKSSNILEKCDELMNKPDLIDMKGKQSEGVLFDSIYSTNRAISFDYNCGRSSGDTGLDVRWLEDVQKNIEKNIIDRRVMLYILKRMRYYIQKKGNVKDIFAIPCEQRNTLYDDSLFECFNINLTENPDLKQAALEFLKRMRKEIINLLLSGTCKDENNGHCRPECAAHVNDAADTLLAGKILSYFTDECGNKKKWTVSQYALFVLLETVNYLIGYINNCIDIDKKLLCRQATFLVINVTDSSSGEDVISNEIVLIDKKSFCSDDSSNGHKQPRGVYTGVTRTFKSAQRGDNELTRRNGDDTVNGNHVATRNEAGVSRRGGTMGIGNNETDHESDGGDSLGGDEGCILNINVGDNHESDEHDRDDYESQTGPEVNCGCGRGLNSGSNHHEGRSNGGHNHARNENIKDHGRPSTCPGINSDPGKRTRNDGEQDSRKGESTNYGDDEYSSDVNSAKDESSHEVADKSHPHKNSIHLRIEDQHDSQEASSDQS